MATETEMAPLSIPGAAEEADVFEQEIEDMSCGQFCSNMVTSIKEKSAKDWGKTLGRIVALCSCLYLFLFSLDLMGTSFKVLGSCEAGGLFSGISNPIAGLMIGILATVLVQSSSTSTSIVVSLVGAGSMSVQTAVPVIMGANIGTSVTNTIVSMGHATEAKEFERAFSGATVHDMFNFLSVLVLLPIEWATGMIFHLTSVMTPAEVAKGKKWTGPIKIIVSPFTKVFLNIDKKIATKIAGGGNCADIYAAVNNGDDYCGKSAIIKCACDKTTGALESCPAFFSPMASQADEMAAGGAALFVSLVLLCFCLAGMVKVLQSMVMGTSSKMLRKATSMNGYLAIIVGMGITILVQSSSITTSVLTPLVGVGVLPLEKMLPLTLGANIGTTLTAFLASMVSEKVDAVHIALCHLFFNLIGIAIWYPIPFMRNVPLNAARGLGSMTRRFKAFPLIYIAIAFVVVPLVLLGVSSLYQGSKGFLVLGIIFTVMLVFALGYFLVWWNKRDGKQSFFTMLENRQEMKDTKKGLPGTLQNLQTQISELQKHAGIAEDPKLQFQRSNPSIVVHTDADAAVV